SPWASWLEDPLSPPWLLAPSSPPWPGSPLAPPGSLVRFGLVWTILRLGTPLLRLRLVPPSLRVHLDPLLSSSTTASRMYTFASVASAIGSTSALQILLVTLAHRLSVSASGSSTTCSAAVCQPPGVVNPSSSMAPPSIGSTVGRHHGCGMGLTWLLLLQVPPVVFLAPSSVWSALVPPWLLPLSSPPLTLFVILLPGVSPPPEPPPKFPPIRPSVVSTVWGRVFQEGGDMSGIWICFVVVPLYGHIPVFV
ncbi:hypothetical protein M9458_049399, partial [Cirrhinus mrigala]